jgi:hypothetical protein
MEMGSKVFNTKHLYSYKRVSSFLIDEIVVVQIGSDD